jgi:putative IMPACT (imprinted ancient) family translation regulator
VRAYGDAVRDVLEALPRAFKVATHTVAMTVPYAYFERVRQLIAAHRGRILDEAFGAEVEVTARFLVERLPPFQAALQDMVSGTLPVRIIDTDEATIMPLDAVGD